MKYTTLGRTGLKVSVAGLGCGGFSAIGKRVGKPESDSVDLVRMALDRGVNFIDTSANYGTEKIVGKAIADRRHELVISTKASIGRGDDLLSPEDVIASLDNSLVDLKTDCIDIFHLHGVAPDAYIHAVDVIVEPLIRERNKGKFKHLGMTEVPPHDTHHESLEQAIHHDSFDVIMVAYHMLHQSARRSIFPVTREKGIGVLDMFAVRLLFSEQGRLKRIVDQLVDDGQLPDELKGQDNPLGFLIHERGASSVIDAAYRYCRHTAGIDVVLFGTGNPDHLNANIDSILSPPLPGTDVQKIESIFGKLIDVGLDAPGNVNR
ncbi:MAG: aldo/keto reductase [Gemmatimonadetes bacterium]|nr:aldo/keto reductase [Gemmatimonadota bacterium]|tara:strand:+ start:1416 stop:2375 length:960 start_codon:yes stop_codon:yes gene_type:complete